MAGRNMNFTRRPALLRIQRIKEVLEEHGPLTPIEIAEQVFCVPATLKLYLEHMAAQEMVHISGWTREPIAGLRAIPRPLYKLGPGVNKKKPRPFTSNEVARRFYRRGKDDPDNHPNAYRCVQRWRIARAQRDRQARIERLTKEGYPVEMILALGAQLRVGPHKRSPTPDQIGEIIRLRDSGHTWDEVAANTGVSRTTVRKYYKKITEA